MEIRITVFVVGNGITDLVEGLNKCTHAYIYKV